MLRACVLWDRLKERLDRFIVSVHEEIEEAVGEQLGCELPVAGRLRVTDRVDDLPMFGKPSGRAPVQLRDRRRRRSPQFEPKQLAEKMVVSKPRTFAID